MTSIIIAGDTCPIGRNQRPFEDGNVQMLLNDLSSEFDQADLSILNLECPLIRTELPIEKCGPNLGAPSRCINGLKAMGVDVVGLANNHIMDHGPQGLRTTIKSLRDHEIEYVGAGENIEEARKILVREVHGLRIGILAVTEYEFCIASNNRPGANPMGVIDFVRNINAHRAEFDKLIVLVHGGSEHYPYPRPRLMNTCRFYVEQGASAVICQHSHCAGCMETYQGVPIVYGQGNFLFDLFSKRRTWFKGALICLKINDTGNFGVRLIPYRQSDGQPGARRMTGDEENIFINGFSARSETIADESFVKTRWEKFCDDNKQYFLNSIHGKSRILRELAVRLDLLHYLDSRDVQRVRLHLIRCESLREAMITVLTKAAEGK